MGDDCVRGGRLSYSNHGAFRLSCIKGKAARDHAHFRNLAKRAKWSEVNPDAAVFVWRRRIVRVSWAPSAALLIVPHLHVGDHALDVLLSMTTSSSGSWAL